MSSVMQSTMLSFAAPTSPEGYYFVGTFVSFTVVYVALLAFYRLFCSPISHIPGPLLARLTFLNEFYYDWVCGGEYYLQVEKMHQKYGPIVRVTPTEVHIRDPLYFNNMFVPGFERKANGPLVLEYYIDSPDAAHASILHDSHKAIRGRIYPSFSKSAIANLEHKIVARVRRLFERLEAGKDTGTPVNLNHALSSLATDVISTVFHDNPTAYLEDPTFNASWFELLRMGIATMPLLSNLPWMARIITAPLSRQALEKMTHWRIFDDKSRGELYREKTQKTRATSTLEKMYNGLEGVVDKHVFGRLIQLIHQAATHNVVLALTTTFLYVLPSDDLQTKLREEVATCFPEEEGRYPHLTDLEQLPLLSACLKEGLRMGVGSLARLARIFPNTGMQFNEYTIPRGTAISMATMTMHMDPDVFPEPTKFKPSRWLTVDPEHLKRMQQQFAPFSRGSRSCIGMQLAYMELYQVMAHMFRPGAPQFILHDTNDDDVLPTRGYLFMMARTSRGMRIVVET